MKKQLLVLGVAAALACGAAGGVTASAEVSLAECDRCFEVTVNALLSQEEVGADRVNAVRKPLYDLNLQQLGYVYEYEIAAGDGYTVIICDNGEYVAQEVVTGESPYAAVAQNLCVYANTFSYFMGKDGAICDIATEEELPAEVLETIREDAIYYQEGSAGAVETENVVIRYSSRSQNSNGLCLIPPHYCNLNTEIRGTCAAVAGGNVIGYYDRFHEDLIPNHSAGYFQVGYFVYSLQDTYVTNAITELYYDMNGTSNGIDEAGFKSGMKKYCAKRNLSCDFSSIMKSGKLNFNAVKTSINEGKPVVLMLSTYHIGDYMTFSDYDQISYQLYPGNHVMMGHGWREVHYTFSDGSTEDYQFVGVSTGFSSPSTAHFNVNYYNHVNSAYSVNIY